MRIRNLSESDHPQVQSLVAAVIRSQGLRPQFYWPEDMLDEELSITEAVGVFKGQELAAVVLYRVLPMAWAISLLATHPQFRRQGLMETMILHLNNAIRQNTKAGFELWLEVHENNVEAQNLYEKLGFRRIGVRNRYYKDGATAWLYSWP